MLLDYIKIQMVQIYEEVIMPTRVEAVKRLYDFFIMWDSHQTEWYIFSQNKINCSNNLFLMWYFLHHLSKVTDVSCIFDKRERKN